MNLQEAHNIAGEPEPAQELHVNLVCPCCAGMWCSEHSSVHNAGDKHRTVYTNYVGDGNCELASDLAEVFYCLTNALQVRLTHVLYYPG